MRVAQIRIHNILGITSLEIEPQKLTVIEGRNGTGKSSVLEAIKSAFKGGHDATLIRTGAGHGEVVLVLDDGTEITKRITPAKSSTSVWHPEYGNVGAPANYLQKLTDALGLNPIAFLTAPPKKRTEYLLESLPIVVSAEEMQAALGTVQAVPSGWNGQHALESIDAQRGLIYDRRTGLNRAAKEKRSTVSQLYEGLPQNVSDPDEVARQIAQSEEIEQSQLRTANRELDALRDTMEARIADARAEFEAKKERIHSDTAPYLQNLREERAALKELLRTAERDGNTRRVAQQMVEEAAALEKEASEHTEALQRLDELKQSLLKGLPIKGIEIKEGEIFSQGVPFDRLNTAERVRIAMELAALRSGDLGLICIDGLECLDSSTYAEFEQWAQQSQSQFVVTRVSENELSIGAPAPSYSDPF